MVLTHWVQQRPYDCFAVCLYVSCGLNAHYEEDISKATGIDMANFSKETHYTVIGLLLREVRPGILVKTGMFETTLAADKKKLYWPSSTKVDWVVL